MSSPDPAVGWMVQGGGFGLAAYLVIWLTRRLNGRIDGLRESIDELRHTVAETNIVMRDVARTLGDRRVEQP